MTKKTMKFSLRSSLAPVCVGLSLLLSGWGHAAPITYDMSSFPDPAWSVMPYSGTEENRPYANTVEMYGKTWINIYRGTSPDKPANSAQIIYNGGSKSGSSGTPVADAVNQIGDIRGSVILAADNWGGFYGVVLRSAAPKFETLEAYHLGISTSSTLVLVWGAGSGFVSGGTTLASETLAGLLPMKANSNHQYLLEFSFIGMTLEASLFEWNTVTDQKGDLLGSLSYTDDREQARATGYFGIRGGRYGNNRQGYFREVEFEAIPEPSVALLLLPIGALLLVKRRS